MAMAIAFSRPGDVTALLVPGRQQQAPQFSIATDFRHS
jgi:hypothetical protein